MIKNVANNVAQGNSQHLTEQWKKGELKEGEYYVKLESGKIDLYFIVYDDDDCDEIIEILAPVPSYGDCLINEALIKDLSKKVNKLIEENAELKELLKEWVKFYPIILYEHEDTLKTKDIIELREKTVEVLK